MNDNMESIRNVLRKLAKINYIKPGEVPNINLYMDQVTTFMDEHLSDSKRHEDDKILTKTMINNYTKNDLLPPPVRKKYSKDHLYVLAFIYYFKNILSISDIQKLIKPLTDNFFGMEEIPNLDNVYREIYNMCKSQASSLSRDILEKAKKASDSFEYLDDKEEKDFLLSFDVYMKKNMIESLIDDYTLRHDDKENKKDGQ